MPRPRSPSPFLVLASFAASLTATCPATSSPVVRAELEWRGRCENRLRLEAELLERGVDLVRVSGASGGGERLKLFVTAESGGDFSRPSVVATLELEGNAGGRERRVVEASDCRGLQSAIAVILAVFAQQTQPIPPPTVAEHAPVTTPSKPEEPKPAEPIGEVERAPKRSTLLLDAAAPPSASTNDTAKSSFSGGELRLGTTLKGGYGWVDAATFGPSLHVEWRPTQRSIVALRAAVSSLTTLELRLHDTDVALGRRYGMLAAKVDTPLPLLNVVLGVELGSLSVSASELSGAREDRATWLSLLLMPELDLPLYDRILFAQLGTGLAFAPTQYQFRYQDTEGLLADTRRFDWRAEVGLAVQLTPRFP